MPRIVLAVYDPDEYDQVDDVDRQAWRDRQALEREIGRRRGDWQ
jgi:hypothetical protein